MPSTAAQLAYLEVQQCISGSWDNECCSCTSLDMLCYGGFLSYSTPFIGIFVYSQRGAQSAEFWQRRGRMNSKESSRLGSKKGV